VATTITRDGTEISCKDWGTSQPAVFSPGWPLTADAQDLTANMTGGADGAARERNH